MSESGNPDRPGGDRPPVPGSVPFEPTQTLEEELRHLLAELPTKEAATVPLLLRIQEENGVVSPDAESWVAQALGVPPVKVREVVSFYSMLKTRPVGRVHIRVCRNLSCTLVGAEALVDHIRRHLGCGPGQRTPDGEISWELVECLGACEMAPMLQWNDEYVGRVDATGFDRLHRERCRGGGRGE